MDEVWHILPDRDLHPHTAAGERCKCKPEIENIEDGKLVIHNSWDGREILEEQKEGH